MGGGPSLILMTPVDAPYRGVWGVYASGGYHPAVDYPVPVGTPVRAAADGTVIKAGWADPDHDESYGLHVRVQFDDGGDVVIYGHASALRVKISDRIKRGQIVMLSGTSGNSTGPHVHMEVREIWDRQSTAYDFTPLLRTPAEINGTTSPLEDDMPTVKELLDAPLGVNPADGKTPVDVGYSLEIARNYAFRAFMVANSTRADVVAISAAVESLATDTPVDLEAVKAAAREGANIDEVALAAALAPLLNGITQDELEAALRKVFADAATPDPA